MNLEDRYKFAPKFAEIRLLDNSANGNTLIGKATLNLLLHVNKKTKDFTIELDNVHPGAAN